MAKNQKQRYCVVYRTGTRATWKWHQTDATDSAQKALTAKQELERSGYEAHLEDYEMSILIGLPDTYHYEGEALKELLESEQKAV